MIGICELSAETKSTGSIWEDQAASRWGRGICSTDCSRLNGAGKANDSSDEPMGRGTTSG